MKTGAKIDEFEVIVNEAFSVFNDDVRITPSDRKHVLSAVNGYENSKWRFADFQNFIWNNITETALSAEERENLVNRNHSSLTEAAKSLRLTDSDNDIGKGSELAEIVLYGIMKHHYGALPVVPKIFYKQNSQDNAKGADSIHIVIDGANFSIWMGEAKFYNEIEDARLGEIVNSVGNSLDPEKLKRENSTITNIRDLDLLIKDSELREKIRNLLHRRNSTDDIKPHLHIPILLLHECKETAACKILSDDYRSRMKTYHRERAKSYFRKQVAKLSKTVSLYESITFHVILFPVPSKKIIVDRFLLNVTNYKDQDK